MGSKCSDTCNQIINHNQQYQQGSVPFERSQPQVKSTFDKISKNRIKAEFPKFPSNIQSKIDKLSKYQRYLATLSSEEQNQAVGKIYRCKYPFNSIYMNLQDRAESYPIGKCIIYKLKERDEFAGYFQGTLNQNYAISSKDCIIIFSNGCYFEGLSQTQGRYTNENTGFKYQGGWRCQMPEGYGKQRNNKGQYVGEYQNGEKHGKGNFIWDFGALYQGNFEKRLFHGQGRLIDQNQRYEYEGQFKKGEKYGRGIENTTHQKYQGEFKYGLRNGFGKLEVYRDQNKSHLIKIYQGQFYQNQPHGKGLLLLFQNASQKNILKGLWTNGKITTVLTSINQSCSNHL